jgi:hypothetical protein
MLKRSGVEFKVKHGTYTTTIETKHGRQKYQTNEFNDRVFIAAGMIKKDVLESETGRYIMSQPHKKVNFGHNEAIREVRADRVLNIDISSAYATCLYNSGMISEKTNDYLRRLRKEERLPAIGMLAKSNCTWYYKGGECTDIKIHKEKTYEIFMYLIEEVNYTMKAIEWELGSSFFFYWVDGVFFDYNTPVKRVEAAERVLIDRGYRYKYEAVTDFSLTRDKRGIYTIDMIKGGEQKIYQFSKRSGKDEIREMFAMAAVNVSPKNFSE